MHRVKKVLAAVGGATGLLVTTGAGTALADNPAAHGMFSFSGENIFPAGTMCDFNLDRTSASSGTCATRAALSSW